MSVTGNDRDEAVDNAFKHGYRAGVEAAKEATRKWAANYPVDVFPEPADLTKASSEALHASWARHTCKQIEREISELAPAATPERP